MDPRSLTPNHVSFVDDLFVIGTIDRPIRFVVCAEYFKRPLLGRVPPAPWGRSRLSAMAARG